LSYIKTNNEKHLNNKIILFVIIYIKGLDMKKAKYDSQGAGVSSNIVYYSDKVDEEGINILAEGEIEVDYELDNYGVERSPDFYTETSREYTMTDIKIEDNNKIIIYEDIYREMIKADSERTDMDKETDIRFLERDGFNINELSKEEIAKLEIIFEEAISIEIEELIADINPEDGPFEFDDVELEATTIALAAVLIERRILQKQQITLKKDILSKLGLSYSKKSNRHRAILQADNVSDFLKAVENNYPVDFKSMIERLKEKGGATEIKKYYENIGETKPSLEILELKKENIRKTIRENIAKQKAVTTKKP